MLRPPNADDLSATITALKAEAHRRGLTDKIVDEELAAYNAERRNAPPLRPHIAPVLKVISDQVSPLGETAGVGSTAKMVNQLLAGVHIATAAEASAPAPIRRRCMM